MPPLANFATEKDVADTVKQWELCLGRIHKADNEEGYLEEKVLYVWMMTISKAMNDHKDFLWCVMDYIHSTYKCTLEKQQLTLPFALLKVAVEQAQTALNCVVLADTIHVRPQQAATHSSMNIDAVESHIMAVPAGRKAAKGRGKAKAGPEDLVENNIDSQLIEKHG